MGLHYSQIFNTRSEFDYRLSRHAEQYLSEQPFYSSFTITRVSPEASPTGLSQAGFSTQLKTALSSSLSRCRLTLDHKTALRSHLFSMLVQNPLPQKYNMSSLTASRVSPEASPAALFLVPLRYQL
jgi:hypothetical protein